MNIKLDFTIEMTDEKVTKEATTEKGVYLKVLEDFDASGKQTLKLTCPTNMRANAVGAGLRNAISKSGKMMTIWQKHNVVYVIRT